MVERNNGCTSQWLVMVVVLVVGFCWLLFVVVVVVVAVIVVFVVVVVVAIVTVATTNWILVCFNSNNNITETDNQHFDCCFKGCGLVATDNQMVWLLMVVAAVR